MSARAFAVGIAVLVAACATSLAACGGVSKEDYEKEVGGILDRAGEQRIGGGAGNSLKDQGRTFTAAAGKLDEVADDLDEVEAPDEVDAAHNDLVAGLRSFARRARELGQAATRGDQERLLQLAAEPVDRATAARLTAARERFIEKGYDLGALDQLPR